MAWSVLEIHPTDTDTGESTPAGAGPASRKQPVDLRADHQGMRPIGLVVKDRVGGHAEQVIDRRRQVARVVRTRRRDRRRSCRRSRRRRPAAAPPPARATE